MKEMPPSRSQYCLALMYAASAGTGTAGRGPVLWLEEVQGCSAESLRVVVFVAVLSGYLTTTVLSAAKDKTPEKSVSFRGLSFRDDLLHGVKYGLHINLPTVCGNAFSEWLSRALDLSVVFFP